MFVNQRKVYMELQFYNIVGQKKPITAHFGPRIGAQKKRLHVTHFKSSYTCSSSVRNKNRSASFATKNWWRTT